MAICPPNYTQIPNAILDRMHEMTPAEFMVLMAVARKTFGWQKAADVISLTQLERTTGLSRTAVQSGLTAGLSRGMLGRVKAGSQGFSYSILVASDYQSTEPTSSDDGPESETTSSLTLPEPVVSVDRLLVVSDYTQKKELKKDLKKTTTTTGPAQKLPGGSSGSTDVSDPYRGKDGEQDEAGDAFDDNEAEDEATKQAELVDQLVSIGLWKSKAWQAVKAGTISSNQDIVCCRRFLATSSGGTLWNEYLSHGDVPPIPRLDGLALTPEQRAMQQRYIEESDARNAHAEDLVVPWRAREVIQAATIKAMPAARPVAYWRDGR